jgi:hypothetical protein
MTYAQDHACLASQYDMPAVCTTLLGGAAPYSPSRSTATSLHAWFNPHAWSVDGGTGGARGGVQSAPSTQAGGEAGEVEAKAAQAEAMDGWMKELRAELIRPSASAAAANGGEGAPARAPKPSTSAVAASAMPGSDVVTSILVRCYVKIRLGYRFALTFVQLL